MAKSKGQVLLETLMAWIRSWVAFPEAPGDQDLIVALWCLHTFFVPRWKAATAYLHLRSDGPGCGKTTALQVLGALSVNPKQRSTLRPLEVVRGIEQTEGAVTYCFDQVEALQSAKVTDEQAILLSGYSHGGTHGVTVGSKSVEFSTFCPKAFACIGDVVEDLRSRCIVVRLAFGEPERVWTDNVMVRGGEAAALLQSVSDYFGTEVPSWVPPSWLTGRDREIWTGLYSVLLALNVDESMMKRFKRACEDSIEFKRSAARKSYRELIGVKRDESGDYARRLLLDFASILPEPGSKAGEPTGDIYTRTAIERLRQIDGPWRAFQGSGLNPDSMARLLAGFGLESIDVHEVKGKDPATGKRLDSTGRGYSGKKVKAAAAKLAGAEAQASGVR